MPIKNETILITGATSGLGYALTTALASNNTLIACSRSRDKLDQLTRMDVDNNILPYVFDVTDRNGLASLRKKLEEKFEHIDRVILNAGDCEYLIPGKLTLSHFDAMMAVNFYGWINTLEVCLPLLKASKKPHVTGICSQVIFAPFSRASAYGASKAAADYFLKSFAMDNPEIDFSIIYPGFIDTPLTQRNDFDMPFLLEVGNARDRTLRAIEKRQERCVFPLRLRFLLFFSIFRRFWRRKIGHKR